MKGSSVSSVVQNHRVLNESPWKMPLRVRMGSEVEFSDECIGKVVYHLFRLPAKTSFSLDQCSAYLGHRLARYMRRRQGP